MRDAKNFFARKSKKNSLIVKQQVKKDKQGRVHVAMFSKLFQELSEAPLATNSMYGELKEDIESSIEPFKTKEKICIDIFENKDSSDFGRETTIVGFKRYINACYYGFRRQHINRLLIFGSVMAIGILIEILLYAVVFQKYGDISNFWYLKFIEVIGQMFIWQFAGYMSFEFPGEVKTLRRYKQMSNVDFEFKHWE